MSGTSRRASSVRPANAAAARAALSRFARLVPSFSGRSFGTYSHAIRMLARAVARDDLGRAEKGGREIRPGQPGQERLQLPGVMRKRYAELGEDEEIVAGPQTPESVLYVLSTANRTMFLGRYLAAQMAVGMVRFLGDESRQEDVLSQLIRRIVGGGSGTVSQLGSIRLQLRDPSSHEPCGLRPDLPEGPYQGHPRQAVSPRRRSRIASVRKRSAFSRMNPAASRWS